MTEIRMTYAGVDTSPLLRVLAVKRSLASSREVESRKRRRRGAWFQKVYNDMKKIEVEIAISSVNLTAIPFKTNLDAGNASMFQYNPAQVRELARLLNQVEPQKLIFSDEPDVYYNAILVDETNLERLSDWYATATLTFVVPDGVGHAVNETRVSIQRNQLTFVNRSFESVAPRFEFTAPSRLRMFALAHPDGSVFKLGDTLNLNEVIPAGGRIKIDMADGSVWLNESKRLYPHVTSKRFEIGVGTVNIGVSVDSAGTMPNVVGYMREVYV